MKHSNLDSEIEENYDALMYELGTLIDSFSTIKMNAAELGPISHNAHGYITTNILRILGMIEEVRAYEYALSSIEHENRDEKVA